MVLFFPLPSSFSVLLLWTLLLILILLCWSQRTTRYSVPSFTHRILESLVRIPVVAWMCSCSYCPPDVQTFIGVDPSPRKLHKIFAKKIRKPRNRSPLAALGSSPTGNTVHSINLSDWPHSESDRIPTLKNACTERDVSLSSNTMQWGEELFGSVYCNFTAVECGLFITAKSVCVLTLTHIVTQRLGSLRSPKNAWNWRLCLRTGRNTEAARYKMSNAALEHSGLTRHIAG